MNHCLVVAVKLEYLDELSSYAGGNLDSKKMPIPGQVENKRDECNLTKAEVTKAVTSLKAGKAAGYEEIRPEVLNVKIGGEILWLTRVCQIA
ncbi:unnamed protein product [Clavelina lepadiformis]|uniref:Uncharacterized protein n=1 Tax=Clavelina lepadiformis TaxID=159417 RepID=A0ABP0FET4_CLALP